jgi:lysophospholipase L1-like esterase
MSIWFQRTLLGAVMGIALLAMPPQQAHAQAKGGNGAPWVGTWGVAPAGPPAPANVIALTDQTLRLVVHTSIGGSRVRIRLSNQLGTTALRIGAAHIGVRAEGASVAPGTDRVLTFSGNPGIVIPPGAPVLSDPVDLHVAPLSDLAISLYLPGASAATTIHGRGLQTHYISQPGDFTGAATLPVASTIKMLPFLTSVDVQGGTGSAAIVAFGDSITDGNNSTVDANRRWPDWLARRLQTTRDPVGLNARLGVVNRGISGNRLLSNTPEEWLAGRSIQERFDRDVLATSGVRYMTLMIGINDIGNSSPEAPVTVGDLIAGYKQVIARARAAGIAVYGATMTPFEGAGYYSVENEAVRQAANSWIRSRDAFDAVIDFDRALRDPANPGRLLPAYDSGDHLHPSDMGYEAMANAVPLGLFRTVAVAVKETKKAREPVAH